MRGGEEKLQRLQIPRETLINSTDKMKCKADGVQEEDISI